MGRVLDHNREIRYTAEYRANEMRTFPSKLEERMMTFLHSHNIPYEPQRVFYIYDTDGWIIRYYIADFYLPLSKVIIEVDGKKYHEHHKQHDRDRTKTIQNNYPGIEVLRFTWNDLSDESKMDELLWKVKQK